MPLQKYTGTWSVQQSAHLLRRTTYGVSYDSIQEFGKLTLDECIEKIFEDLPMPSPPINHNFADDPNVPIGETWVDKPATGNVNNYRTISLRKWTFDLLLGGVPNIREKMVMFWYNHFVVANINDPRFLYHYNTKLRANALGNFKTLTQLITIDPAMLEYLNGKDNTRQAPNENYARELLELFTIGKGDEAGPGDYTNYTEEDIKEIAKVLTGWIIDRNQITPIFRTSRHDTTTKVLSHRFDYEEITNLGEGEYLALLDIIFKKRQVAVFLATKLYRWFVKANIDDLALKNVILPLADFIYTSNYDLKEALKSLLSSEHFFAPCNVGIMVKNPLDFIFNALNNFKVKLPEDIGQNISLYNQLNTLSNNLQMGIYNAPDVAGWNAYYQEPMFYRLWLNSNTLPARKVFTDAISTGTYRVGTFRLRLGAFNTVKNMSNLSDVSEIIQNIALMMTPKPLSENQKQYLESLLLGTGNTTWTSMITKYNESPDNTSNIENIEIRLNNVIKYMMVMPEYHLS